MTGRKRLLAATRGLSVAGLTMGLSLWSSQAWAQGVGFLTEQERLASYCAGVSEARMRELDGFQKNKCAGSDRKECRDGLDELVRAQRMDRRLWAYLTGQIFTSKEQGPKEKALSQKEMARGSDDWLACKRRGPDQRADDLLICRESQGCLIDARFSFLPP
jgi:hypothetical protein